MAQSSSHYRPEIDGLRGVAILAVVANHVDSRLLPGGFVGVDVFFVISGYLITSIVLREASQGSLSFKRFYARRVRRLLPAAAVMSVVVTLLASVMFLPRDFKDLGASLVAYSAMASNVLFWRWDDYFAGQTRSWPLLHTWSLAVEEQFYLVFPGFVFLVAKRARWIQAVVFGILFLFSFCLSVWQCSHDVRSAYYLLPSRSWELLAGALCSLAPSMAMLPRGLALWLGLAFMTCVVSPMAMLSEQSIFPGWSALIPVFGTAGLIVVTASSSSPWKRLLSSPWLVWIGLVSYSLYLWHWPLLTLARYPWSGMAGSCPLAISYLVGFLSFVVAWLSFRFIETPGRGIRWSDAGVLGSWVGVAVATVACGAVIHRAGGLPQRLPSQAVRFSHGMADWQPRRAETIDLPLRTIQSGVMPRIGRQDGVGRPDFVLWGDSHADALVPAFDQAALDHDRSGVALTRGATPPLVGVRSVTSAANGPNWAFRDAAVAYLQRERPRCVVLAARWIGGLTTARLSDGRPPSTPQEKEECQSKAISETLETLFNAGVEQVWILGEVPAQRFNVPKQLALHELFGWQDVHPASQSEFVDATTPVAQLFQRFISDRVSYLDAAALLGRVSENGLMVNGVCAYSDDNHISATAARAIAPYLAPIFEEMNRKQDRATKASESE
jgi:peptidoglycan/LPS O-acetylase OafA/YrhL